METLILCLQTLQKIYSKDCVSLIKNYFNEWPRFFFFFVYLFYVINLYEVTCQLLCKFLVVRWPELAFSFYRKALFPQYTFNCIFSFPTLNKKKISNKIIDSEFFRSLSSRILTEYVTPYLSVFSPNAGKYGPE